MYQGQLLLLKFCTKHTAQIMVLGVMNPNGKEMPPYIFKPGERVGVEQIGKVSDLNPSDPAATRK